MSEQVETAEHVARSISAPVICDAGAGFEEPLHVTRTVKNSSMLVSPAFTSRTSSIPSERTILICNARDSGGLVDKIKWACRSRDEHDPDFVIIARTDTLRFEESTRR